MNMSHTYAAQGSKSVFLEISERNAATARLLHEAQKAQPAQPSEQARTLAGWVVSRWDRRLQRVGKSIAPHPGQACG